MALAPSRKEALFDFESVCAASFATFGCRMSAPSQPVDLILRRLNWSHFHSRYLAEASSSRAAPSKSGRVRAKADRRIHACSRAPSPQEFGRVQRVLIQRSLAARTPVAAHPRLPFLREGADAPAHAAGPPAHCSRGQGRRSRCRTHGVFAAVADAEAGAQMGEHPASATSAVRPCVHALAAPSSIPMSVVKP